MINLQQNIPDFSPIAAGKNAVTALPTGPTYRELTIYASDENGKMDKAAMIANIENVSIKINGSARWNISGANLVALNEYYGNEFNDGELILPLSRHWLRTMQGEENLCWGTKNVKSFLVEVKLAAGVVDPDLAIDAEIIPDSRDLGMIVELHEYQASSGNTGKKEIPDLPTENGALVALHLKNANIDQLEVKVNRVDLIEDAHDLRGYQNRIARKAGRKLQAGYIHFDVMASNRLDDAVPLAGANDFRVNPYLSAAGDIPILMETLNIPLPASR